MPHDDFVVQGVLRHVMLFRVAGVALHDTASRLSTLHFALHILHVTLCRYNPSLHTWVVRWIIAHDDLVVSGVVRSFCIRLRQWQGMLCVWGWCFICFPFSCFRVAALQWNVLHYNCSRADLELRMKDAKSKAVPWTQWNYAFQTPLRHWKKLFYTTAAYARWA